MNQPVPDINEIIPSKAKTWIGLVSSLLTLGVPYVLTVSTSLPAPWPVVIGLVIAVLGALGIYKGPYKPEGTILAVDPSAPKVAASVPDNAPVARPTYTGPLTGSTAPLPPPPGEYRNPYKTQG